MTLGSRIDLDNIAGTEALTIPEKIGSFIKETSVAIDSFNAKKFNKSIHKVQGAGIYKKLSTGNRYFDLSTKQIPSPVYFNYQQCDFSEYVRFVLKAVFVTGLVNDELERIYGLLKVAAAKSVVSITSVDSGNQDLINEVKMEMDKYISSTSNYSNPVNKLFTNFTNAYDLIDHYNKTVENLKSRDPEVISKRADEVIRMAKILKDKMRNNEVNFGESEVYTLTKYMENSQENLEFLGLMLTYLSETTRVLQVQIETLEKMV